MSAAFPFVRNTDIAIPQGAFVARLGDGIRDASALFDALSRALHFPSYFGRNWDALDECLRELTWLPPQVVLLHDVTPHLARRELVAYLAILKAALDAAEEERRILIVGFAEHTRALKEAWAGVKA